jgi:uncharacterized protein YecT (DUF1311 family)
VIKILLPIVLSVLSLTMSSAFAESVGAGKSQDILDCLRASAPSNKKADCLNIKIECDEGLFSNAERAVCLNHRRSIWQEIVDAEYLRAQHWAERTDNELGAREAVPGYEKFPRAVASLISAQEAWKSFAESECQSVRAFNGPGRESSFEYGGCRLRLTRERAVQLSITADSSHLR